jgi:hypothetical protein
MIDGVTSRTLRNKAILFAAAALFAGAALLATGCGSVKSLPAREKNRIARADTVYVLPAVARYSTKGLLFKRTDSARTERLRARLDSAVLPELARLLPGTAVVAGDPDDPKVLEGVTVTIRAQAFRRTLPRQILSDVSDVVLMIPTFGRNMASPILPSSRLRLEVRVPAARRATRLYHEDEVEADDPAQLLFQVRKVLDPRYRG